MQVLDDEQQAAVARQVLDGAVHRLEQAALVRVHDPVGRSYPPREKPRERPVGGEQTVDRFGFRLVEPPEDLHEREVREGRSGAADAVADENPGRLVGHGRVGEGGDDGGLPDAGVAGQQEQSAAPIRGATQSEREPSPGELVLAPDQEPASDRHVTR